MSKHRDVREGFSEGGQERPSACLQEHLEFLDELRESGITNMMVAQPYLMLEFSALDDKESSAILSYWMATFPRVPLPN